MTDEQFIAYIDVERKAQVEDRIIAALGNQAGVADVLTVMLGSKGTKAASMNSFIGSIGGENSGDAATVGDSKDMSAMRKRIKQMIAAGEA